MVRLERSPPPPLPQARPDGAHPGKGKAALADWTHTCCSEHVWEQRQHSVAVGRDDYFKDAGLPMPLAPTSLLISASCAPGSLLVCPSLGSGQGGDCMEHGGTACWVKDGRKARGSQATSLAAQFQARLLVKRQQKQ
ncbi:semaphorin-3B [Platysternon megacephalum]|uniref:Semaphorin-3B n=1 Tax=Platysternon megacephalum TaxID=55544 RepID=A0A4D9DSF3_9SAUR|nr:semaphorin-3B [Platysternon megacephalum]